jgi:RimJ/RimL family protein N-acetyltransferase
MSRCRLAIAGAADLADAWLSLPRRLLPYWSAAHWTPPLHVGRAREWFDRNSTDYVFRVHAPEPVGIAVLVPDDPRRPRCYRALMGLSDEATWHDVGVDLLTRVTEVALVELNGVKSELLLLPDWQPQRAAAQALGYQLEATYPDACAVDGGYRDLELWGRLQAERARQETAQERSGGGTSPSNASRR